jgi:hypothetical protein
VGVISDLLGESGVIENLLLWQTVGQVVQALMSPAFNALQQDVLSAHPNVVITPDVLVRAVVAEFVTRADAQAEAAKSGLDASRLDILLELATVRIDPPDLAEAVLRSYMSQADAAEQAQQQGVTPDRFEIMTLLAGDAIGPEEAATALRRGYIAADGTGPDSTSYLQAIAESRLHDKWAPVLYELTKAILSPQDAAQAVVRNFLPLARGLELAALNGVDASLFATYVDLAGDAPSPTDLAEAYRRGVIPYDSGNADDPGFVQGIQQGRIADKWIPMLKDITYQWPTPTDALEARLVGQVTTEQSQQYYEQFGGDPQWWQLLYETRGESPTPLELGVLANRGDIPWTGRGPDVTSYEQGFYEGRWRDKWLPVYQKLAEYLPPESTVVTLLEHGVITDTQAADLLAKQGMTPDLITAYIADAHTMALSEYRGATVAQVAQAYYEQIITADEATPILEALHVTPTAVKLLLLYEDMQRDFQAINSALSRVRSLYAARKITTETAKASLATLGLATSTISEIMERWQVENSVSVQTLSAYVIGEAVLYEALTVQEGLQELQNIGYTPFDAWVTLCAYSKAILPDRPPQGPPAPQGAVTPGTT